MDLEEQENEFLALESILDSSSCKLDKSSGEIRIEPNLKHSSLNLFLPSFNTCDGPTTIESAQNYEVEYLPPFTLNFTYPLTYPSTSPPDYTLSCIWLSRHQINLLCNRLDDVWKEQAGSVVLFTWYQFLQDESLDYLGITDNLKIEYGPSIDKHKNPNLLSDACSSEAKTSNRAVQDVRNKAEILPLILEYNQTKKDETFKVSTFSCYICFEKKVGSKCMQFTGCDHVYCQDCIASYFSIQIKDGNVKGLSCPTEKCNGQPLPKKVQELVSSSLYERYEKLLLQTTLDTMEDVAYCPLLHCQSPVILEKDSSFAQCPSCSYAFCLYCKLAYHGVAKCKIASSEMRQLCEKYEAADSEEKLYLEKRYGKKVINVAVHESQTHEWMQKYSRSCPSCQASIEKIDGCNKMTCFKCRAYFCWLCLHLLDRTNPYQHYNNSRSPCFNKLFLGMDDPDEEFFVEFL